MSTERAGTSSELSLKKMDKAKKLSGLKIEKERGKVRWHVKGYQKQLNKWMVKGNR